eukprot:m.219511 g.219511  ORF g.219511 m.219511 type:complete len:429 (-) comp22264_c0_seq12:304-1590(-)
MKQQFEFFPGLAGSFELQPYPLKLRSAFGTSHSSTSVRHNVLFTLRLAEFEGVGEAGLPPKKPGVYEADVEDCTAAFEHFTAELAAQAGRCLRDPDSQRADVSAVFADTPAVYFPHLRQCAKIEEDSSLEQKCEYSLRVCLAALDSSQRAWPGSPAAFRAPKSALESAIFDCWGKVTSAPLYQMVGLVGRLVPFYCTVSLNAIPDMIRVAEFNEQYSKYSKIKLGPDMTQNKSILKALAARVDHESVRKSWSIDANAAWTAELALQFLSFLQEQKLGELIFMVEQPFPVHLSAAEQVAWIPVKKAYGDEGIFIFADESVRTKSDIPTLAGIAHGVNIKLEKAGGFRDALQAIAAATAEHMQVWLGVMVGSTLNSNCIAHLTPLAVAGDMDGALLTDPSSDLFGGGFTSTKDGQLSLASAPGLGVWRKE